MLQLIKDCHSLNNNGIDIQFVIPIYYQIEQKILSAISEGIWKVGDFLITEEELVSIFSVSRGTVRNALASIANIGLITRNRGEGFKVVNIPRNYVS